MEPLIVMKTEGAVGELILNQPESHNSLTLRFLEAIAAALDDIAKGGDIHVLMFTAKGRSFSTGFSLGDFAQHRNDLEIYLSRLTELLNKVVLQMISLPVPIIAVVHDVVSDGALGLVLAGDIVLVAPQASFIPFDNLNGISPIGGWTALLPEIIGRKRAAEALMRNKPISASLALKWGLANALISGDHVHKKAKKIAREIAKKDAGILRSSKRLLWHDIEELARRLEEERRGFIRGVLREGFLKDIEK